MSDRIMKKISLNVLLRFLSKYSHWNLVRKSDGYHLFFLARDGDSERRSHNGKQKTRKLASVTCNKIRRNKIHGKSHSKKDVFVVSPDPDLHVYTIDISKHRFSILLTTRVSEVNSDPGSQLRF